MGQAQSHTLEFWFRRKYNLPPTDPRFLDATIEQIETDFWAHHALDHPVSDTDVDDEEFDAQALDAAMASDDWEELIKFNGN